jgi:hypothetical protein
MCNCVSSVELEAVINGCIAICCCVVMYVYRSSRLRGKRSCPPGSACYNEILCDSSYVVTRCLDSQYRMSKFSVRTCPSYTVPITPIYAPALNTI